MSTQKATGKGFTPPNYTQTPNTLFDLLPVLSNAELRVTLVLIRETLGWHRQRTGQMSVEELAAAAGLSPSSAKTGIKEGMDRGTVNRYKVRDERNRPTYKYGVVVSDETNFEEFERPRKTAFETVQNDVQPGLTGQNLTGSDFGCFESSTSQNLTGSPEGLIGQNLTGSYKEERNLLGVKEKREGAALPARENPTPEVPTEQASSEPQEGGASPSQVEAQSATRQTSEATDLEKVPGGGAAAAPGATEAYLRRKFSTRFVDSLLDEVQPLGVERRVDWFALPLPRVEALVAEAVRTHGQHGLKVPTRLRDLLDDECRRVSVPLRPQPADAPTDDDGEIDMAALMAQAPLSGRRTR